MEEGSRQKAEGRKQLARRSLGAHVHKCFSVQGRRREGSNQ